MVLLDFGVYDFEDFGFGGDCGGCDFSSLGAETICRLAVCEARSVDAYIELRSKYGAARCKRSYACIRN